MASALRLRDAAARRTRARERCLRREREARRCQRSADGAHLALTLMARALLMPLTPYADALLLLSALAFA